MELEKAVFMEQYVEYTMEMEKAMQVNQYKTNNKYDIKLNRLNERHKNQEYYSMALNEVMNHKNLKVCSFAAVDSLRNHTNIDKATKSLKEIATREDSGIVGFSAGITLKEWLENGVEGIL